MNLCQNEGHVWGKSSDTRIEWSQNDVEKNSQNYNFNQLKCMNACIF